jgi:hypothetical protein
LQEGAEEFREQSLFDSGRCVRDRDEPFKKSVVPFARERG